MTIDSFSLMPRTGQSPQAPGHDESSDDREPPLRGQRVERFLHNCGDVVVYLIHVRLLAELIADVDRGQHLHRDLRRQGDMAEEVAYIQAPWRGDRDREHLEPE